MRKYYRIAILTVLLSMVFAKADMRAVMAAEEGEAVEEAVLEEGENIDDAMLADPLAEMGNSEDMGGNQVVPAVSTPDGMMVASSFPDDLTPLLFHKTTTTYQGTTVDAAQFDNGYVLLLYVTDASGVNGSFKQYNETTGELTDFRMIAGPGENYVIILPLPTDFVAPEGFEEVVLDWNGQSLSAFVNTSAETEIGSDTSASDYLLLYAISSNGRQGLYLYDQVESTYQRYLDIKGTSSSSSGEGVLNIEGVKEGNSDAIVRLIIICAMALLIIVLIILVIVLAVKLKEYSGYDYIDEEDYNAINGSTAPYYEQAVSSRSTSRGVHVADDDDEDDEEDEDEEIEEAEDEEQEEIANNESYAEPSREQNPKSQTAAAVKESHSQTADTARTSHSQAAARTNHQNENSGKHNRPAENHEAASRRRSLLETTDIADLDDILNDPNLTSNLPMISEIQREINRQSRAERAANKAARSGAPAQKAESKTEKRPEKKSHSYEEMQVTVDNYEAGMPAMVDTEMIAEDMGDENSQGYDDLYGDDDYYMTRAERKERKALEKQKKREAKDAEREAKYLEKERKRAEKHKKYGYDEATPMDWSEFGNSMREEPTNADNRRPVGYDEEKLPGYMKKNAGSEARMSSDNGDEKEHKAKTQPRRQTEEERANAAADAVIAAARGNENIDDEEVEREAIKREQEYREYRKGARNQYEEFRRHDEEEAERARMIEEQGRRKAEQPVNEEPESEPSKVAVPSFSEDFDEDFEFEFLNIKRPQ